DLDDTRAIPAALGRELLELEQQHRLADAAETRVDQATAVLSGLQTREDGVEALDVAVPPCEERGHRPRAGAVGVRGASQLHQSWRIARCAAMWRFSHRLAHTRGLRLQYVTNTCSSYTRMRTRSSLRSSSGTIRGSGAGRSSSAAGSCSP